MNKDFNEVDDLELEKVNGGKNVTARERDLVYRGEEVKEKNLVFTGNAKKAIPLGGKKSDIDGKKIVGDFADKTNFC